MHIDTAITAAAAVAPAALVERAPLVAALSFLSGNIVERRNTIPILSNVLIVASEAGARLTGTDLDIQASTDVPAVWDAPASFTVDVVALLAAVKACEGDTVRLQLDAGGVTVSGDGMASRLATLPADDFPAIAPIGDNPVGFVLDAATLSHDWTRVQACQSTEETRYYLNGILMHAPARAEDRRALVFAATDGHRLGVVERECPAGAANLPDSIIPRKAVKALLKAVGKKAAGEVALQVNGARIDLQAGGWSLASKLIDGTFPDYTRVIPHANDKLATFDGAALAKAAGNMCKVGKEKTPAIRLTIDAATGATLQRSDVEGGRSAVGVAAAWKDNAKRDPSTGLAIGFNGKYLCELLGGFPAGDVVLHLADASAPTLMTCAAAPELRYVLMPMRVDGSTPAAKAKPAACEPIVSASEIAERAYVEAFKARDGAGMRAAVDAYRESDMLAHTRDGQPERVHSQLAMHFARVRSNVLRADKPDTFQAKREGARLRLASKRDSAAYRVRYTSRGSFRQLGQAERDKAAALATLTGIDGYRADDARDVLPVMLQDGRKVFVTAAGLADTARYYVDVTKADGTPTRSRRSSNSVSRHAIARIIQPAAKRTRDEAPAADTTELQATVAALVERMAGLESTVAAQAAELQARTAVATEPAAVQAVDGTDARDAYIAALLAERDELRNRAEGAEAMAADLSRIAELQTKRADDTQDAFDSWRRNSEAATHLQIREAGHAVRRADTLQGKRRGTAARLVAARANARTARREAIGHATARRIAETELQRLQPLAAALAGLMATPALVEPAGNVVQLRTA